MARSLDKTLEAFQDIETVIEDIKTKRNIMTDKTMIEDYDKILVQLEKAVDNLLNAVVIFQKYEGTL